MSSRTCNGASSFNKRDSRDRLKVEGDLYWNWKLMHIFMWKPTCTCGCWCPVFKRNVHIGIHLLGNFESHKRYVSIVRVGYWPYVGKKGAVWHLVLSNSCIIAGFLYQQTGWTSRFQTLYSRFYCIHIQRIFELFLKHCMRTSIFFRNVNWCRSIDSSIVDHWRNWYVSVN